MAPAARRRAYRRSYTSRRWRRYRKYNYFTAKIEFDGDLVFPTSSGQPKFSAGDNTAWGIGNALANNADFKRYIAIFQMYRIRGIRFEFTPTAGNSSIATITHTKPIYVGWNVTGTAEEIISMLKYSDKAILLDPLNKVTKYWSMWGYQDDWKIAQGLLAGYIAAQTDENATDNTGPAWSYRITFYVAFKSTK